MDKRMVVLAAAAAMVIASYFILPPRLRLWIMLVIVISAVAYFWQGAAWGLGMFLFLTAVVLATRAIVEKKV